MSAGSLAPRVRYVVVMSLDGFIAGPKGESDWIPMDPEIDFAAFMAQFDTYFMGRKTYEAVAAARGMSMPAGLTAVFSRTLRPADAPGVTVVPEVSRASVEPLRAGAAKDIWLFGGGLLFRSFLKAGLVDSVEVTVVPVLLGAGIPLLPSPSHRARLSLRSHRVYRSGLISLDYAVTPP